MKRCGRAAGIFKTEISTWTDGEDWVYAIDTPKVLDPEQPHMVGRFIPDYDGDDTISRNVLTAKVMNILQSAGWQRRNNFLEISKQIDPDLSGSAAALADGSEVKGDKVNSVIIIPFNKFMKDEFGVDL